MFVKCIVRIDYVFEKRLKLRLTSCGARGTPTLRNVVVNFNRAMAINRASISTSYNIYTEQREFPTGKNNHFLIRENIHDVKINYNVCHNAF